MHPTISFEIQIPPKSELRNDLYAQGEIDLINSDPGELNKQVAFLLVFNSFGPLTTDATDRRIRRWVEYLCPAFPAIFQEP